MLKYSRSLWALGSLLLLVILAVTFRPVGAVSADTSGAVTQSYNADASVLTGMVVEFKAKDQTTVTPLTAADITSMQGVVVPTNDAAVVLTPQSTSTRQVLVASSGRYSLLVSNQDGAIKTGDYVTMSALPGIAMKASNQQRDIVGRAAGSFNGSGNVIGSVSLKNSVGAASKVAIGNVAVDVHLASNPLFQTTDLPSFLNKAANNVAGKPGSARIYLSVVVLLATFVISGVLFYSGVRTSITAIGRNPLAKKVIGRNMVQTATAGLIIFVVGVLVAYLVLI